MTSNIFSLFYSEDKAAVLLIKARLAIAIIEKIRSMDLNQKTAAIESGVSQPKISNIMRGKLHNISIDMLIKILTRLGGKVTISV